MRTLFRILSLLSLARAIRGGPVALGRREARRRAHRAVRKALG